MGKVFEFRPGSYIDSVSGNVGTEDQGEFVRSDIGIVRRSNGVGALLFPRVNITGDFSVSVAIKAAAFGTTRFIGGTSDDGTVAQTHGFMFYLGNGGLAWSFAVGDGANYALATKLVSRDIDFINLIGVYNSSSGNVKLYVNGVLEDEATNASIGDINVNNDMSIGDVENGISWLGDIGLFQIYDHILTAKERAKLYKEFLQATPTSKIIQ